MTSEINIVSYMRGLMESESRIETIEGGGFPQVDNQRFLSAMGDDTVKQNTSFQKIIDKYVYFHQ